eukprot:scaffold13829_cov128-Isochrysis_galbana.AAC.3
MTDPPIDNTQAREQDAPGTHDAKRRAPVHGHTGDVPHDKALSNTRGRSWTELVQSPDVAAGASSCNCKGGSLAGYSPYTTFGTPSDPAPAGLPWLALLFYNGWLYPVPPLSLFGGICFRRLMCLVLFPSSPRGGGEAGGIPPR